MSRVLSLCLLLLVAGSLGARQRTKIEEQTIALRSQNPSQSFQRTVSLRADDGDDDGDNGSADDDQSGHDGSEEGHEDDDKRHPDEDDDKGHPNEDDEGHPGDDHEDDHGDEHEDDHRVVDETESEEQDPLDEAHEDAVGGESDSCPVNPVNKEECGGEERGKCGVGETCECNDDYFGAACECSYAKSGCQSPHCHWCAAQDQCLQTAEECKPISKSDLPVEKASGGGGTTFFFLFILAVGGAVYWMHKNKKFIFADNRGDYYGEMDSLREHEGDQEEAGYDPREQSWRSGQTFVNVN